MTIYVYMRKRLITQGLTTESELSHPNWSLWQTRRFPWGELERGNRVLLLDHWRDEDRLSWELTVTEADHQRVDSKPDAIDYLVKFFGLDRGQLEDDAYLAAKKDGPGALLAWRGEQVRRINLPRPPGLKLARHGWARLEDDEAHRLLDDAARMKTPISDAAPVVLHPTAKDPRQLGTTGARRRVAGRPERIPKDAGSGNAARALSDADRLVRTAIPEQR